MKVGVLAIGDISPEVLERIAQGLSRIYPDTTAEVIENASVFTVYRV